MADELERLVDKLRAEGLRTRERGNSNYAAIFTSIANELAAALQQAGAQAVAWRYARPPEDGCLEETYGPWNTIYPNSDLAFYERAVKEQGCRIEYAYLGQPPSIPEPSENDIAHAMDVFRKGGGDLHADAENVLIHDRHRLRERIGTPPPPLPEGVSEEDVEDVRQAAVIVGPNGDRERGERLYDLADRLESYLARLRATDVR